MNNRNSLLPDIGASVIHRITQDVGKVEGYGHQLVQGTYQTTIRVHIALDPAENRFVVKEDLASQWLVVPEKSL